ncbi:5'-methylthioadenosine/S-adenosylhomocysteine nucleosidase [Pseudalkalibacillus berkeleyi]|uniref:5'-methylthioadenosine/S-adenosylhomocysteine nucleosidase n=1 Tax=Pseudalkalibacillus berkeleyi TaxID=1069813 RepID=A0ABS9H248_9BACL|nr:5'-methylthioadenosine/S-adenosylhomocysteine nucleosidase [Pseudalkalibacillus berkeleyi]MCF6138030.1 5'-methylthioadenosine/S-adenosylhomocysteine nucleosidase [Pseudalkalibacillus berkeleyi]
MKIAIIGAMDEEVIQMQELIEDCETNTIAGCTFYTGQLYDQEVVLLRSGIGKVNAAIATTLLNQLYKPDYVINTGSAGGFNPELNVGDVVISSEIRHHDVDVTAFGYEYGQVPQLPAFYMPDALLVQIAEESAKEVTDMKIVKGLIASGDSFMNDAVRVKDIRGKFPELHAAEMEAAAIAQVCHQFNVPFVVIRSLSDIAGKDAPMSFDQFLKVAAKNSAELILKMVKELKKHG